MVLTESWVKGNDSQCARLAGPPGLPHYAVSGVTAQEDEAALRDEIRMLSGRTAAPAPGLSFCDAWETAGAPAPGYTWSNNNPWATQLLWPNRRIDYIFSAAPRPGGAGHPLDTALLGTYPISNTYPSDHYALQSSLRY